jgi:segregation and condensation protein A
MASTLMRVKAKMMIPRPELDEDGDIIDPREELMQQLIDYKRFRDASDILKNMAVNNSYSIRRQFEQELSNVEDDELEVYFKDITLYDLARKFKEAIESKPVISQFELNREPIRLEKQKELILKYFDGEGRLKFTTIINSLRSRMEIVVTFLAVLDLVRDGLCSLEQSDVFGEIEIFHLSLKS